MAVKKKKAVPAKKDYNLSEEGRSVISKAQQARWKKFRRDKKASERAAALKKTSKSKPKKMAAKRKKARI